MGGDCTHTTGLNQAHVIRVLQKAVGHSSHPKIPLCGDCLDNMPSTNDSGKKLTKKSIEKNAQRAALALSLEDRPELWSCCTCGLIGCGRNTEAAHALSHFGAKKHAVSISHQSGMIWCYACDDELGPGDSDKADEIRVAVMKLCHPSSDSGSGGFDAEKTPEVLKAPGGSNGGSNGGKKKKKSKGKNGWGGLNEGDDDDDDDDDDFAANESPKTGGSKGLSKGGGELSSGSAPAEVKGMSSTAGLHGLANLGNTCFFNSIMQCLSSAVPFRDIMLDAPVPLSNDGLPTQGPLTTALRMFIHTMWRKGAQTGQTVSPRELFGNVIKKAPRFRGFQQQDAQELLRYLLNGVQTEEGTRLKKIGKRGADTMIDAAFRGYLASTVVCATCGTPSRIREPFMDLSLPVSGTKNNMSGTGRRAFKGFSVPSSDPPGGGRRGGKGKKGGKKGRARRGFDVFAGEELDGSGGSGLDDVVVGKSAPAAPVEVPPVPAFDDGLPEDADKEKETGKDKEGDVVDETAAAVEKLSLATEGEGGHEDEEKKATDEDEKPPSGLVTPPTYPSGTLEALVTAFTSPEVLGDSYGCAACTAKKRGITVEELTALTDSGTKTSVEWEQRQATKQFLLDSLPPVLTLHLKRFAQSGFRMTKVSRHVVFPPELDVSGWCTPNVEGSTKYRLTGVVVHSGGMGGGHYTACVYHEPTGAWWDWSDRSGHSVTLDHVLRCQAYVLFYTRVGAGSNEEEEEKGADKAST